MPEEDRECMGWVKDNGDRAYPKGNLKPYNNIALFTKVHLKGF